MVGANNKSLVEQNMQKSIFFISFKQLTGLTCTYFCASSSNKWTGMPYFLYLGGQNENKISPIMDPRGTPKFIKKVKDALLSQ